MDRKRPVGGAAGGVGAHPRLGDDAARGIGPEDVDVNRRIGSMCGAGREERGDEEREQINSAAVKKKTTSRAASAGLADSTAAGGAMPCP